VTTAPTAPAVPAATRTGQAGIFALGTASHAYLEFDLIPGAGAAELLDAVADLREPHSTIGGLNLVAGFRPELFAQVEPEEILPGLIGFNEPVPGIEGFQMPATQHDLCLWVAGASYDTVFDASRAAIAALAGLTTLAGETSSWSYQHDRDLTGFIDGSANPSLLEAPSVALVPPGTPGAGGSVLLLQLWRHNADAWHALPVPEQERIMGRTKAESLEIDADVRDPSSHVSRTELVVDGEERKIFRRNMPYGSITAHGTMFVGFAVDRERMHRMLERMSGAEDGIRCALTRYSSPLSGSYYWVPAVEVLAAHATPEED